MASFAIVLEFIVDLFHFWKKFYLIAELLKGNEYMLIDLS